MLTAIDEERVREVLSPHEQKLLRLSKSKSLDVLAQIYRMYEGENGVREALDRINAKISEGIPVRRVPPASVGGIPLKRAPAGTVAGAEQKAAAPPTRPTPTGESSTSPPMFPPPTPVRALQTVLTDAQARDDRVLALLRERARSCISVAHELGVGKGLANKSLRRLERHGNALRTSHEAHDYPRADPQAGGRKSKVWKAVDGPDFEEPPEAAPAPAAKPKPEPAAALNGKPASNGHAVATAEPALPTPAEQRTYYIESLLDLAGQHPEHAHLFDRIERLLGL